MLDTHNFVNKEKRWDEIIEIWDEFMDFHMDYPHFRFMQVITTFQNWYERTYKTDGFYIEDDILLERFKEFLKYVKGEIK